MPCSAADAADAADAAGIDTASDGDGMGFEVAESSTWARLDGAWATSDGETDRPSVELDGPSVELDGPSVELNGASGRLVLPASFIASPLTDGSLSDC